MVQVVRGFSNSPKNGVFLNSCFAHCQSERQDTWFSDNSPLIGNKVQFIHVFDPFVSAHSRKYGNLHVCKQTYISLYTTKYNIRNNTRVCRALHSLLEIGTLIDLDARRLTVLTHAIKLAITWYLDELVTTFIFFFC